MIGRLAAVAALAIVCGGQACAQKVVTFERGAAQVVLPYEFVATEQNDGKLRAIFGPQGTFRLELTVKAAKPGVGGTEPGATLVRDEAKRRDLKLFELPGRAVFMEPVADRREGDRTWRSLVWYIGFGHSVAIMTLSAPVEDSPELKRFLGKPLNDIIASVRRRRP